MADGDTKPDMTAGDRHVYGPRAIGALVPSVTRATFRHHPAASAQLMMDWAAIVGPGLATVSMPRRLSSGTLTIACAGGVAMELQYMQAELLSRINTHFGQIVVRELKFVQTMVTRPPSLPPQPPPEAIAAAESAVADLPAGDLRSALSALGRVVLGERKPSTAKP